MCKIFVQQSQMLNIFTRDNFLLKETLGTVALTVSIENGRLIQEPIC